MFSSTCEGATLVCRWAPARRGLLCRSFKLLYEGRIPGSDNEVRFSVRIRETTKKTMSAVSKIPSGWKHGPSGPWQTADLRAALAPAYVGRPTDEVAKRRNFDSPAR